MIAPFISVVIPTFNRCGLLPTTIQSVLDQTYQDFEILIVDNGSTDDTVERVREIKDNRIRYIQQLGSGSPASPRNRGIYESKGMWVAFLDSDDLWLPEKLEQLTKKVATVPCELVSHRQAVRDEAGRNISTMGAFLPRNVTYRTLLLTENAFATSSVALRLEFLKKQELRFNEAKNYFGIEDYDLWLRVLAKGGRAMFIPKVLGVNKLTRGHMGTYDLLFRNLEHMYKDHVREIQQFTDKRERLERRLMAGLGIRRTVTMIKKHNFAEGLTEFFRTLNRSPIEPIRYGGYRLRQRIQRILES